MVKIKLSKKITKKISCLFVGGFFLLSSPAYSQIQKGNILVGGDLANFNLGLKKGSLFSMRIDPKLAIFFADNFAVGAYINFGLQSVSGNTAVNYGAGVLARYYFPDKNNEDPLRHSRFLVEGNAGFTGANVTNGSSTNGLGLGVGPGYTYFITRNIGLEILLKYNGLLGFGNALTQSNLNLNVGLQVYLPTRKLRTNVENDVK